MWQHPALATPGTLTRKQQYSELGAAWRKQYDVDADAQRTGAARGTACGRRAIGHRTRISTVLLIKSSPRGARYGAAPERVAAARSMPAPKCNSGGMLIGRRPLIGALPMSARPAAVWETGKPPHATR